MHYLINVILMSGANTERAILNLQMHVHTVLFLCNHKNADS